MSKFSSIILNVWPRYSFNIFRKKIKCGDLSEWRKFLTCPMQPHQPIPKHTNPFFSPASLAQLSSILGLFWLDRRNYTSNYDVAKHITDIVIEAERMILKEDLDDAKSKLNEALKIAKDTNVFGNISSVYELLASISLQEGNAAEAENILADGIEELIQVGFAEDHNTIIKFKLKLARLYHSVGNNQLADIGFQNCISAQEKKLGKSATSDDQTTLVYLNSLFWYGKFLMDRTEFNKAKTYMKKTLDKLDSCSLIVPTQKMVVLYHNAEIDTILKNYDTALQYLYDAIDLCNRESTGNSELPLYVVKVGQIFVLKGSYDVAQTWCETASKLATKVGNKSAIEETTECLQFLNKVKRSSTNPQK